MYPAHHLGVFCQKQKQNNIYIYIERESLYIDTCKKGTVLTKTHNVSRIHGELQYYLRQQRELHDWQPKVGDLHDEQLHDRYPVQQPKTE